MNEKEKAALGSIAVSAGLTAAKGIIGVLTGSLAILSEAGHRSEERRVGKECA